MKSFGHIKLEAEKHVGDHTMDIYNNDSKQALQAIIVKYCNHRLGRYIIPFSWWNWRSAWYWQWHLAKYDHGMQNPKDAQNRNLDYIVQTPRKQAWSNGKGMNVHIDLLKWTGYPSILTMVSSYLHASNVVYLPIHPWYVTTFLTMTMRNCCHLHWYLYCYLPADYQLALSL